MRLIEIIGANGAGKSTLCNALLKMDGQLVSRDEAVRRCAVYWIRQAGSRKRRLMLRVLLGLATRSRYDPLIKAIALDRGAGVVNAQKNGCEDFIGAALKLASTNEKRALSRFKAIEWFTRVLDEAMLLSNTPLDDLVLLDESVCHLVYGLSSIARFDPEDVEAYFQQVPAPFAVVDVKVSPDLHLANVLSRAAIGHVMPGHRDIVHDERALAADLRNRRRISEIAGETLARRNIHRIGYQSRTEDPRKVVDRINEISNSSVSTR